MPPNRPCRLPSAWTGRCAAPDTSQDDPIASAMRLRGAPVIEAQSAPRVVSVSARGSVLMVTSVMAPERAPGARHQLAEIVAGDVLHHAAAGLEGLAAAGHRCHAEEMVARGARLDPARSGQIGSEHAADRADAGRAAQQRAVIRRFEGELLALAATSASISAIGVPARADSTSSSGSYRVTPVRPDRSSVRSDWDGRPMPRLLPRPATSSVLLSASAQTTASSTSFASRGFSRSKIVVPTCQVRGKA